MLAVLEQRITAAQTLLLDRLAHVSKVSCIILKTLLDFRLNRSKHNDPRAGRTCFAACHLPLVLRASIPHPLSHPTSAHRHLSHSSSPLDSLPASLASSTGKLTARLFEPQPRQSKVVFVGPDLIRGTGDTPISFTVQFPPRPAGAHTTTTYIRDHSTASIHQSCPGLRSRHTWSDRPVPGELTSQQAGRRAFAVLSPIRPRPHSCNRLCLEHRTSTLSTARKLSTSTTRHQLIVLAAKTPEAKKGQQ